MKCFTIARYFEHRTIHESSSREDYLKKMDIKVRKLNRMRKEHIPTIWDATARDPSSPFPSNP